jgi:hypothetical protein
MSMRLIEEKELEVRNDDIEILVDRITELEEMMNLVRDVVLLHHKEIRDLEKYSIVGVDDIEELQNDIDRLKWELDFGKYKRDVN